MLTVTALNGTETALGWEAIDDPDCFARTVMSHGFQSWAALLGRGHCRSRDNRWCTRDQFVELGPASVSSLYRPGIFRQAEEQHCQEKGKILGWSHFSFCFSNWVYTVWLCEVHKFIAPFWGQWILHELPTLLCLKRDFSLNSLKFHLGESFLGGLEEKESEKWPIAVEKLWKRAHINFMKPMPTIYK